VLRVVTLDRVQSAVDLLTDVGTGGRCKERIEPRLRRNPEDVLRDIFVPVFEDRGALIVVLGEVVLVLPVFRRLLKRGVSALERVGDVLEEEQSEDEVLVLGRLDAAAHPVSRFEQFLRERKIVVAVPLLRGRAGGLRRGRGLRLRRHVRGRRIACEISLRSAIWAQLLHRRPSPAASVKRDAHELV
jgi:hypothetical protein